MDVGYMKEVPLTLPSMHFEKGLYVCKGAFSKFNLRLTFMG